MKSGYDHPPHCLLLTNGYLIRSVHLLEGIPRLHRTLLAKCLYTAPERAAEKMSQEKTIRLLHGRRTFPACLFKMQEISEHFALHFTTANVSFLQILHRIDKPFSVFFVLVPADSCHIQHFLLVSRL